MVKQKDIHLSKGVQVVRALNLVVIAAAAVGFLATIGWRLLLYALWGGNTFFYFAIIFSAPFVMFIGGLSAEVIAIISLYRLPSRLFYLAAGIVMIIAGMWLYASTYLYTGGSNIQFNR